MQVFELVAIPKNKTYTGPLYRLFAISKELISKKQAKNEIKKFKTSEENKSRRFIIIKIY